MNKDSVDEIVDIIVTFLIDRTGNEIFDKWKERRKIRGILKEDSKNIKRIFNISEHSDLYNVIEEFIMSNAFTETIFYSAMRLTFEQENELWERFKKRVSREMPDTYVDLNYKNKIVRCVNLHNEALNKVIMDDKSRLHMKVMQKQHESIENSLNSIIDMLNPNTELQAEDMELGFGVEQLDSIMKSYRFDINLLRKSQNLSVCGSMIILLLMAICVPWSLRYIESVSTIVIMFVFLGLILLILLIFWRYISIELKRLICISDQMRKSLWDIHFELYMYRIQNKYMLENKE